MNKKFTVKYFLKAILASFLLVAIVFVPVVLALGAYGLSLFLAEFGWMPKVSYDIYSYLNGALLASSFSFFFVIWLISTKKIQITMGDEEIKK